jgi:hypothetical protein
MGLCLDPMDGGGFAGGTRLSDALALGQDPFESVHALRRLVLHPVVLNAPGGALHARWWGTQS